MDIVIMADQAVRELGFGYSAGTESKPNKKEFRKELKRMLRSQLPGETYVYVIDHDQARQKYSISKYFKRQPTVDYLDAMLREDWCF